MAGLLMDEELLPFFGNPNIQRQGARARALAAQRDVNTLPDPRTYAAISGLLGQAPDELGFSVLNPAYEDIQRVGRPAFAVGTALGVAPMMRGMNLAPRPAARAASGRSQRGAVRVLGESNQFPQAEAMRLAQQRAALPIEQGGLGLPPNNTALDRATAMGFDTDAYHSTNVSDITQFDLRKSNRGEGASVALTPENAQAYGNITYPLKIDQHKIFDPNNKDQFKELKNYVENLMQQQQPYKKDSLSFYPFTSKKVLENLSNPQTGAYYLENEIISKSLKDLGYSGARGMESGQLQLKIFNPDQIRSRFAAFDPLRKTAATAAAAGLAAPDLLAGVLRDDEERQRMYRLSPGLLSD